MEVEVFYHDFETEQAALEYAVSNQRNRRNMTDADIFRCIEALDSRKDKGGDKKSKNAQQSITPIGVIDYVPSSHKTAELVGVSPRQIERARTVIDHAEPEIRAAVLQGDMSIHKAYKETQDQRKAEQGSPHFCSQHFRHG